mgnify:CR=1 FL=1
MVVGATADPVVLAQIRAKARSILDALERETEDDEEDDGDDGGVPAETERQHRQTGSEHHQRVQDDDPGRVADPRTQCGNRCRAEHVGG